MQEYTALESFWKRHNKVLLDKLALDREKQTLEDENSKLKALLKQYLDGESYHPSIYYFRQSLNFYWLQESLSMMRYWINPILSLSSTTKQMLHKGKDAASIVS